MTNGLDPSDDAPLLIPGSGGVAEHAWKSVGTFWRINEAGQNERRATIVLIAPRWILAVRHAAPLDPDEPRADGLPAERELMQFPHGSARVRDVFLIGDAATDVAIASLDQEIPPPPGGYLRLIDDPSWSAVQPQLPGAFLLTGQGIASGTKISPAPTVAWVDALGRTFGGAPQPMTVANDSGGVQIWRRPASGAVAWNGPAYIAGNHPFVSAPGALQLPRARGYFADPSISTDRSSTSIGTAIRTVIAQHPPCSDDADPSCTARPRWHTLAGLGVSVTSLRPPHPANPRVTYGFDNDAVVSWDAPTDRIPRAEYTVLVEPNHAPVRVAAPATNAVVPDLTPGVTYTFRVTARNANVPLSVPGVPGQLAGITSAVTWRQTAGTRPDLRTTPDGFYDLNPTPLTFVAPRVPRGLSDVTARGVASARTPSGAPAGTTSCLSGSWDHGGALKSPDGSDWTATDWATVSVDGQAVTPAPNATFAADPSAARFEFMLCGYGPGETHTVSVRARSGASVTRTVATPTAVPTGTTLPATRVATFSARAGSVGGAADYCVDGAVDVGDLAGIPATVYVDIANVATNQRTEATVSGFASRRTFVACGLNPASTYMALVTTVYEPDGGLSDTVPRVSSQQVRTPSGPATGAVWPAPTVMVGSSFFDAEEGERCVKVSAYFPDPVMFDWAVSRFVALLYDDRKLYVDRADVSTSSGRAITQVCGVQIGATYEVKLALWVDHDDSTASVPVNGLLRFTAT